jgi:hypothetical protein
LQAGICGDQVTSDEEVAGGGWGGGIPVGCGSGRRKRLPEYPDVTGVYSYREIYCMNALSDGFVFRLLFETAGRGMIFTGEGTKKGRLRGPVFYLVSWSI